MRLIRTVLDRFQLSRMYFNLRRRSYFKTHSICQPPKVNDKNLEELISGGVVVLPEFYSEGIIMPIKEKALKLAWELKRRGLSSFSDALIYQSDGIYRLRNLHHYLPEASILLENEYILNLVKLYGRGYLSAEKHCYLDFKPDVGVHDYTSVPHMDSWLSSIKIFILLSDVEKSNAPLVYWRGSHLDWSWRREFDYANYLATEVGSAGICPPSILRNRSGSGNPLQEVVVEGKAGTVIIADTRTFHRASNLCEGYRLQLVQKFPSNFARRMSEVLLGK